MTTVGTILIDGSDCWSYQHIFVTYPPDISYHIIVHFQTLVNSLDAGGKLQSEEHNSFVNDDRCLKDLTILACQLFSLVEQFEYTNKLSIAFLTESARGQTGLAFGSFTEALQSIPFGKFRR